MTDASLAYCVPPLLKLDRTSTASGYSTSTFRSTGHFEPRSVDQLRHGQSRRQAQHAPSRLPSSLFLSTSSSLSLSEGAWRFYPRCRGWAAAAARLPPLRLSQPTAAEPASVYRSFCYRLYVALTQWALHVTSTRPFLLPLSQPTAAELLPLHWQFLLPAIRHAQWALHVASTRSYRHSACDGPSYAVVHHYYATLGCCETRAALVLLVTARAVQRAGWGLA